MSKSSSVFVNIMPYHIQHRHDEHDRRALPPTSSRCLHVNGAVVQASPGVKWAGCEEIGRHQVVGSEAPGSPLRMDASTQAIISCSSNSSSSSTHIASCPNFNLLVEDV